MLVFDIETNGFYDEVNVVHTITIYDTTTKEYTQYDKDDSRNAIRLLNNADIICGHNIIGYDVPVLKKLYSWFNPQGMIFDTYTAAKLIFSNIESLDYNRENFPKKLIGSQSLEAYGHRLGILKGDFSHETDWKEWSKEMSEYCKQDVTVTVTLLKRLLKEMMSFTKQKGKDVDEILTNCYNNYDSLKLEHEVETIVSRQTLFGFKFKEDEAQELYLKLLDDKVAIVKHLRTIFTTKILPDGPTKVAKRNNKSTGLIKDLERQPIKILEFNPGSTNHIVLWLNDKYGYEPTVFTEKGNPKMDADVVKELPYPEAEELLKYFVVNKVIGQLAEGKNGWLKKVNKGRIHGRVNTCGASTGRMTHSNPNVAQTPAVLLDKDTEQPIHGLEGKYGVECRSLFTVPLGYKLVGCDAAGLELRCLSHYMAEYDKGEYGRMVLEEDIHTVNQRAAGLDTRGQAKTFIYAFMYGAGDEKLGKITEGGKAEGRKLKESFFRKIPALKTLIDKIKKDHSKNGYVRGLDGRIIFTKSAHAALNYLLQGAGAIVMKKALVILDNVLQRKGLTPGKDYEFVANIHDEFQIQAKEELSELVGKAARLSIQAAGKAYNFNACPLDGEYKIGSSWYETH